MGQPVELNYGPLPPNDPLFGDTIRPGFCSTAPGCDTIPLTVIAPSIEETEDHLVRITLSWDPSTRNNLQLYLWNEDGTRLIGSSASDNQPEKITLYRPEGNYNIVVHHPAGTLTGPSGPNTGYRLTLEMVTVAFEFSIYESLDPEGSFGDFSSGGATDTSGFGVPEGSLSALAPPPFAFTLGDQDFAALAGRAVSTEALKSQGTESVLQVKKLGSGKVNGLLLGMSVGVIPLVLAIGGGLFFKRRSGSLLEGV